MRNSLLSQLARAVGILRPAPAPPFGGAWIDAMPSPEHDRPARPRARRPYSEEQKAAVWGKAQPIVGWDPADWRVDHKGNPIFRQHYRDTGSAFGWEIGRIAGTGSDDLGNLRPQLCQAPEAEAASAGRTLNLDPFAR
jgi:hypothetical protein